MNPVIEINQLHFEYQPGYPILEDVNLSIAPREFIGVIGPNGGGKSTLFKLILGLIEPTEGTLQVLGQPPQEAVPNIGYVPQFAHFNQEFPITVEQTVQMAWLQPFGFFKRNLKKEKEQISHVLKQLAIDHLKDQPIGHLSGGQLQRTLVARALACDPSILILDEPTTSFDPSMEKDLFDRLKTLNEKMTILIASHDLGFISHYIDRVACVNRKLTCHPTAELTEDTLQNLYHVNVKAIPHTE